MKVFFSWSGTRSKQIAEVFREWLPSVLQAIQPYFTPSDIEKGRRWGLEIAAELDTCASGLVFLTRDNLEAPWIMFEAGALSKQFGSSRLYPILFNLDNSDLKGPLTQFQATLFEESEIKKLLISLNKELGDRALDVAVLEKTLGVWWPELKASVSKILEAEEAREPVRTDHDILAEILDLSRLSASRSFSREQQFLANQLYAELKGSANDLDRLAVELADAEPDAYNQIHRSLHDIWSNLILSAKMVANIGDPSSARNDLRVLTNRKRKLDLRGFEKEDNQ